MGKILRLGIGRLTREGYTFRGIKGYPDGEYDKINQQDDCPSDVLLQWIEGTFDPLEYAELAISFMKEKLPTVDMSWLEIPLNEIRRQQAITPVVDAEPPAA